MSRKHLVLILTEPTEGKEAEFNDYYENLHLDEVLATTKLRSAQRFRLAAGAGEPCPLPYLAVYETQADDPDEVIANLNETRPQRQQSDALNRRTGRVWVFEEIGPKHTGDPEAMSEFEDVLDTAVLRKRGQGFHDFEVGETIHHHWGRTITEADAIQFCHLTLAYNPLYFNREYAKELGHPDIVVNPQLVFNVILGLSVEICSESLGGPFLGVYDLIYHEPVYPGDTLTAVSTTVEKRESTSTEGRGVVSWYNEGFNQHGRKVIEFRRTNLAIWKGQLGGKKEQRRG